MWFARKTLHMSSLRSWFAITECKVSRAIIPPENKSPQVPDRPQHRWVNVTVFEATKLVMEFGPDQVSQISFHFFLQFSYQVCMCDAAKGLLCHFLLETLSIKSSVSSTTMMCFYSSLSWRVTGGSCVSVLLWGLVLASYPIHLQVFVEYILEEPVTVRNVWPNGVTGLSKLSCVL